MTTSTDVRARLRDYLTRSGPTCPGDLAEACGVPLAAVMRELDSGALRQVGDTRPPRRDGGPPARHTFHSRG